VRLPPNTECLLLIVNYDFFHLAARAFTANSRRRSSRCSSVSLAFDFLGRCTSGRLSNMRRSSAIAASMLSILFCRVSTVMTVMLVFGISLSESYISLIESMRKKFDIAELA